ncbi:MAG: ParB N-terminal domain-containing protein [Candidatus Atabeyarchaeum deiterrae]
MAEPESRIEINYTDPKSLKSDPNNPRTVFDQDFIASLSENYKHQGVIEPIEVDEHNMIRRGHNRVLAAIKVGVKVPVRKKVGLSDQQWFERQLADDALRKSLNELDRMWAYATGVVNINSGKFHTIAEVKKMYEKDREHLLSLADAKKGGEGGTKPQGQSELSNDIGVPRTTINIYIKLLGHPEQWKLVEDGIVGVTSIRDADRIVDETMRKEAFKALGSGEIKKGEQIETLVKISKTPEIQSLPTKDKERLVKRASGLEADSIQAIPKIIKEAEKSGAPRRVIEATINPKSGMEPEVVGKVVSELPREFHERVLNELDATKQSKDEQLKRVDEIKTSVEEAREIYSPERVKAIVDASRESQIELLAKKMLPEYQAWSRTIEAQKALDHVDDKALFCPVCGEPNHLGWLCHNVRITQAEKAYEKMRVEQLAKLRTAEKGLSEKMKK